jgi:hypothetical protein
MKSKKVEILPQKFWRISARLLCLWFRGGWALWSCFHISENKSQQLLTAHDAGLSIHAYPHTSREDEFTTCGKVGPLGRSCPLGVNTHPFVHPPKGEHTLLFRRTEGNRGSSSLKDNFTPREQSSPLWAS